MKTIAFVKSSPFPWSRIVSCACLFCSLVLLGSALLAGKIVDPGPEADGVYSCGKEVKGKYSELGKLEIKGQTYATYSEKAAAANEKKAFDSFTTDGKGHIKWSTPFHFISYSGSISGASEYSLDDGNKPTILVNYSENHQQSFMLCTKEK